MANDMSEDNAETQTDDPATLKVLRGNAKRWFTNLVKLVRDLMADHGNRTSIKNRREDIIGAFQECSHFNNCYIAIRPDDGSSAAWISTIETDLDFWLDTIEEHLFSRVGESVSSKASV
jgi:hypothetical protein